MTTSSRDCQVLVVGAGPTGLVLAAQLLARGIETRIVDKGDGPARESRAVSVHARTLELLDTMGHAEGRKTEIRAGYVVGCDGAHSRVRHELGLAFAGQPGCIACSARAGTCCSCRAPRPEPHFIPPGRAPAPGWSTSSRAAPVHATASPSCAPTASSPLAGPGRTPTGSSTTSDSSQAQARPRRPRALARFTRSALHERGR